VLLSRAPLPLTASAFSPPAGLLYLSTADVDFTAGRFAFLNGSDADVAAAETTTDIGATTDDHIIEPRAGRLLLFTSGFENLHQVSLGACPPAILSLF
jgi:hypothetical protein